MSASAPGGGTMATVDLLLRGYVWALERLEEGIAKHDRTETFCALFEALNWATSIDDRIRAHWAPEGQPLNWEWRKRLAGAELMDGVRFVRNHVHHDWADAIYVNESGEIPLPMPAPAYFTTWRWRPVGELPPGGDERGRAVYEQQLQGEPVAKALFRLGVMFGLVGQVLEPPRPDHD